MAEYKDKLIKEFHDSPFKVDERAYVKAKLVKRYPRDPESEEIVTITGFYANNGIEYAKVRTDEVWEKDVSVPVSALKKFDHNIGYNPFPDNSWRKRTHTSTLAVSSIINKLFEKYDSFNREDKWKVNGLEVHETNFNPYVIDKNGNKRYYQRELCWTLEQKQSLIDSMYNFMNCGQILIRERSYKWVEAELKKGNAEACFCEVIDGKQRLNAVNDFMNDKFPDSNGRYYSDLSRRAQWEFEDLQCFTYAVMDSDCTDEDVISAFLAVNFTGVPQSKEHIEHVESIKKNM